jgi:hypothetical protein
VRIYAIRNWTGQSYKQVKDELGWADFQVRSDTAIRRHQALVNCAFSFCWDAWFGHPAPPAVAPSAPEPGGGERGFRTRRTAVLAPGDPGRARLARPVDRVRRWWTAWPDAPPPRQLQALINSVAAGCGLHLYIPN